MGDLKAQAEAHIGDEIGPELVEVEDVLAALRVEKEQRQLDVERERRALESDLGELRRIVERLGE